jgi:hypothetical protein
VAASADGWFAGVVSRLLAPGIMSENQILAANYGPDGKVLSLHALKADVKGSNVVGALLRQVDGSAIVAGQTTRSATDKPLTVIRYNP